jgi:predicted metalloendopeptidase
MVMTQIVNGGGEEEEEARKHGKHLSMGGEKYFSKTRSAGDDDFMSYVVEGLGYDPDQFLMEDSLVTVYNEMNMAPLEMLKEIVKKALETELYVYCGDDVAQKITENAVASTGQILEKQLPSLLSYPLSYYFCEKYVDDKVKAEYTEYAETMREVFAKRIEANEWLSDPTKQKALEKLNSMKFFIGEPDSWDMEALPKLRGELLLDDILETKQTRIRAIESLLGKDKRNESMTAAILLFESMPTYVYNAGYLFPANSMLMLPAFMMEPEYTSDMDAAKKYAMFYVIGHEMTHGFDLKGSTRDANGDLNNWWEPADREKFEALNDDFSKQISTFEIAPGIMANGENTVTEDVADLGGLNIALDALNEYLEDKGATEEEIKEAQKTFFEYHAMRYRAEYTPLQFQRMLGDVHSVNMVRVNGMVQHMDSWYELYNVQEGDALYLPADKRIKIW